MFMIIQNEYVFKLYESCWVVVGPDIVHKKRTEKSSVQELETSSGEVADCNQLNTSHLLNQCLVCHRGFRGLTISVDTGNLLHCYSHSTLGET